MERRLADALGGRVILNPTGSDQSGLVAHRDGQTILRADGETETQQFVIADAAGIGAVAAEPTGRVVATEAQLIFAPFEIKTLRLRWGGLRDDRSNI